MASSDTSENSSNFVFNHSSGNDDVLQEEKDENAIDIIMKNRDPKYYPPIDTSKIRSNMYTRFITYRFTQTQELGWTGHRYHFQLTYDGEPLFHTKTKSRRPTVSIPISAGSDMHFSQKEFAAYLLLTNSNKFFSLRKKEEFGDELMTVEINSISAKEPRDTVLNLFEDIEYVPSKLKSLKPKLSNTGHWELSFLGKETIPSVKNCILAGIDDSLPYIMVRRVSQSTLEIDAPAIFPNLCVFGLALSIWLS